MRTTIDLPDELFRRAKAQAALQGQTLKDLIIECLERGLHQTAGRTHGSQRYRSEIPLARPATGVMIPSLTNAEIEELFIQQDLESVNLGYLRLSTTPAAMRGAPLTVSEAWTSYQRLLRLPEVGLAREPAGCEALLESWTVAGSFGWKDWTDAYLAAFAIAAGCRLVSLDRDIRRFEGLNFLLLEP
jgi:predicted nucleic acid-binding protein